MNHRHIWFTSTNHICLWFTSKALAVKRGGRWEEWTYEEYLGAVRGVAKGFLALGLGRQGGNSIGFLDPKKQPKYLKINPNYTTKFPIECQPKNWP